MTKIILSNNVLSTFLITHEMYGILDEKIIKKFIKGHFH